jgi:hypothetical protein
LKEQETAKKCGKKKEKEAVVQETTSVQETAEVPMEDMSEPYMAINTFSQTLTVIFQSNTPFF